MIKSDISSKSTKYKYEICNLIFLPAIHLGYIMDV